MPDMIAPSVWYFFPFEDPLAHLSYQVDVFIDEKSFP